MKKNNNVIYFGVFFLAAFIAEMYCLLQFREDLITVSGVGVVLLIAAYLWMDSIRSCYTNVIKKLEERYNLFNKIQKAIYATIKKQASQPETDNKEGSYKELINEIKELKEEQKKLTKMLIKYNREDTKYIISKNKADIDRMIEAIEQLTIKEPIKYEEQDAQVNEIEDEVSLDNQVNEDTLEELGTEPEEVKPLESPIELSDDPNKQLSPEDIAALFASMGQ